MIQLVSRFFLLGVLLVMGIFIVQGCSSSDAPFEEVGRTLVSRPQAIPVNLPDGRVLLLSSFTDTAELEAAVKDGDTKLLRSEIFDPASKTFVLAPAMLEPRNKFSTSLLPDGRVLVVGGRLSKDTVRDTTEIYDPHTGRFTFGPKLLQPRAHHKAVVMDNGDVYFFGGENNQGDIHTVERYDFKSNRIQLAGTVQKGGSLLRALRLTDGKILLAGGPDVEKTSTKGDMTPETPTLESYDPTTQKSAPAGEMAHGRIGFKWTLLSDGQVLITGPLGVDESTSVEIDNPNTHQAADAGVFQKIWGPERIQTLPNGQVLVAGEGGRFVKRYFVEQYDPATKRFKVLADWADRLTSPVLALLQDGSVLLLDTHKNRQTRALVYRPQ